MKKILLLLVSLFICERWCAESPKYHLKPLGSHPPQHGIMQLKELPRPEYFYEWFVKPGVPVLFKSVLNTIDFPAFRKWTDDYMRENFSGQLSVEIGKKETRNEEDTEIMTMSKFLDSYHTRDVYVVSDVQDGLQDIPMLKPLRCGGFQKAQMMMLMWFSSGGTKSVLHNDALDNINCLLDGSKDLIFIDKAHKDRVEAVDFEPDRGYSKVDVDKVDLLKFPLLEDIPWFTGHMTKGDCLFIPSDWYHQVNSYGNRNLAVNYWFEHLPTFNQTDCDKAQDDSYKSIADYPVVDDITSHRLAIQRLFEGLPMIFMYDLQTAADSDTPQDVITEAFDLLDQDSSGYVTWEELSSFDVNKFANQFSKFFGLDTNGEEESEEPEEPEEPETDSTKPTGPYKQQPAKSKISTENQEKKKDEL